MALPRHSTKVQKKMLKYSKLQIYYCSIKKLKIEKSLTLMDQNILHTKIKLQKRMFVII